MTGPTGSGPRGGAPANGGDRLEPVRTRPAPLFVYGTLLFDAVAGALIGRCPRRAPATVPGWRVARLAGVAYPGLVAAADTAAPGELLTDLSWAERRVLDAYEGAHYRLELLATDAGTSAWTYVRGVGAPEVAAGTWVREEFHRDHLAAFLTRLTGADGR